MGMRVDFKLHRFSSGDQCTLGLMHRMIGDRLEFRCFTLEDEHRDKKVNGQTRIPAGSYQIKLRTAGGMHPKYAQRYPFHEGMLWLQNVPGFEWIYIHPGNEHTHTEGCILVGRGVRDNRWRAGFLQDSVAAYEEIYKEMVAEINGGRQVYLTVEDIA